MAQKVNYDKLWKLLLDKKIETRSALSKQTGIAQSTLSKMKRNEYVALEVLVKLCNHLDCSLNDIVEIEK